MSYPPEIKELINKRELARKQKEYALSDLLRDQIIAQGYEVEDIGGRMQVRKSSTGSKRNFLTIFGSGEVSSVGRGIHEYVLQAMALKSVRIAIISTPAGFQPNVVRVHEEIKTFFIDHLPNFHPSVTIVYANTVDDANNPAIVSQLDDADYIFMGPGSPTYAVGQLKHTLLFEKIISSVHVGKSLCLSSAAAIAFSRHCLPVYEIYKVGEGLHWLEGLNGYKQLLNKEMTVIPHFNNAEGGSKTDTSCCYMGKDRFGNLRQMLPEDAMIVGVDENTAQIWDLSSGKPIASGKGSVTTI